jgi:hypothetical protein
MRMFSAQAALAFLLIYAAITHAGDRRLTDYPLTLNGLGPLKIGMSAAEVRDIGYRFRIRDFGDLNTCAQVILLNQSDVGLMFEEGRVVRIEVYTHRIATLRNARVGDSEAKIMRLYGRHLVVEPSRYDDRGHYLKFFSKDKTNSMVFETNGRIVTEIRAGPGAQYVEGCL